MKNWVLIIVLLCAAKFSFAQTECDNLIEDANDLYHSGNYDDCIRKLEKGLKDCSLSKAKREKAFVLLINSNIEKDSMPSVDSYFKQLLLNNPAFKLKDYDGIDDFKTSFNNYYVFPKLSFGARIYYCFPKIKVNANYFVIPEVEPLKEYNVERVFSAAFMSDYRLTKRFTQFSELGYFRVVYNYLAHTPNSSWKMNVDEKLSYIQWDIGTKLYFNNYKRLNFCLMGGVSNHFLATSKLDIITTEKRPSNIYDNGPGDFENVSTGIPDYNSRKLRNPYVPYFLFGGGGLYKFGNFAYGLDIRQYVKLKTINNPEKRIEEPDLLNSHSYMDSNFSLSRTDISLTAVYMFNKVKNKSLKYEK